MKYAHILQSFYGEPWHLRRDYWSNFDAVLQRAMSGQEVSRVTQQSLTSIRSLLPQSALTAERPIVGPVDPETGKPLVRQMETQGPVAIIPVQGVLGKRLSLIDLYCGGVDYAHVREFCSMAEANPDIRVVIFAMDSPGGMSAGCQECGDAISQLGKEKVTLTYSADICCSAAYWLASQTQEIWAAPTAQIGNVGTIMAGEDNSAQWTMEGRKLELFTSSPLKGTGADGKPWTDEDRAYMSERMLQCDARIKDAVKAGRGDRLDAASLDGRWFFAEKSLGAPGQSALDVGMVDQIATDLDELLEEVWASF